MVLSAPGAHAQRPDWDTVLKGTSAELGTALDREIYSYFDRYENASFDSQIMRIGIDYRDSAVEYVELENVSGLGFAIGEYDENRSFIETARAYDDYIIVYINSAGGISVISGNDSELYYSGRKDRLAVIPVDENGGGRTRYNDNVYCGGFECLKTDDGLMNIINYVPLEDYVKGVIPYEMSADWPIEALKAQAVCARTYAVFNLCAYEEDGFDLTDDTYCQVYRGMLESNEITDAAVDATCGQVVRYKGQVCDIYYSSSNGGASEDGTIVFDVDAPYLIGKMDPFEDAADFTLKKWSITKSSDEITEILQSKDYEAEKIVGIVPTCSAIGNVSALSFIDESGSVVHISGRRCYNILGLYSCRFDITQDEDDFIFTGGGWGHNCGMSQWGANAMADVYGYNYEDIIRFYFTGAYVA